MAPSHCTVALARAVGTAVTDQLRRQHSWLPFPIVPRLGQGNGNLCALAALVFTLQTAHVLPC